MEQHYTQLQSGMAQKLLFGERPEVNDLRLSTACEPTEEVLSSDFCTEERPAERKSSSPDPRRIAQVLRRLGGIILVGSAISFAFGGLADLNSLQRCAAFLAFTAGLSLIGAYCGLKVKDDKAARTFLAIATAFLPAHFSQLGALLYSHFSDPYAPSRGIFHLVSPSVAITAAAVSISSLILALIAFAGFSSMARAQARALTASYLGANLLLLVPLRGLGSAVIGFLLLISLVLLDQFRLRNQLAMRSFDGWATRLILAGPLATLIARSFLYPSNTLFASLICSVIAATLFIGGMRLSANRHLAQLLQGAGTLSAVGAWVLFLDAVFLSAHSGPFYLLLGQWKTELAIPFCSLGAASIVAGLSLLSVGSGRGYRALAAWLAISSILIQLFTVECVFSSVLCIVSSASIVAIAFATEQRAILSAGVVGLALGLAYHLRYAAVLYDQSPWLTLAVFGTLTVLASTYVERNYGRLIEQSLKTKRRIAAWQ